MKTEKRKWSKVEAGDVVLHDGERMTVKKVGGGKVILTGVATPFLRIPAEGKAKVVTEVESAAERESREREEARLNRRIKSAAKENSRIREATDAKREREKVEWAKPEDKAEKRIADLLDGKLVAVQVAVDGPYEVPPLDPTTIHSHLLIMHSIEAGALSFADLVTLHEHEHAKAAAEPFHRLTVPHTHPERRTAST